MDQAKEAAESPALEGSLDRPSGEARVDAASRELAWPALRDRWLPLGALVVLLGLVLRAAWVCDDAYITLRTIDNWVQGYGLRWNVDERVQSFTHPLWLLLLSPVYALLRDGFATALLVALATSVCALGVLLRVARSGGHALVALVLLMLSRSFVDFSTSGLENPLAHLLIGLFVWWYAVRGSSLRTLAATAALLALCRIDALLVVLPALTQRSLREYAEHGLKPTLRALALAFSPLIAWELFSLFYYGSLVPNTAYAKLNTGIPRRELLEQGLVYLIQCFSWDPAAFVALGLSLGIGLSQRRRQEQLLTLGAVLYLLYVLWIGGDFMLGRFLTLPLFLAISVLALSRVPLEQPALLLSTLLPFSVLLLHPNASEHYVAGDFGYSGIADERAHYRDNASLMMYARGHVMPNHHWVADGRSARARGERVLVHANVGFIGYFAGPTVHIVDFFALGDALLARLPAAANPQWRIGHFRRHVPPGYAETYQTGRCAMTDARLCKYYEKLHEVVAGELWSWQRLVTIARFQLGAYEPLIDRERYRYLTREHDVLASLALPVMPGAAWDSEGTRRLNNDGLELELGRRYHAARVKLSVDGNDTYKIELRDAAGLVQTLRVSPNGLPGMNARELSIAPEASRRGFDRVLIVPTRGDGMYAVGELQLVE